MVTDHRVPFWSGRGSAPAAPTAAARLVTDAATRDTTRSFAVAAGLLVHFRQAGGGFPVLLLHGSPGSSRALVPLLQSLAGRGARGIAVDLPGFGSSEPLAAPDGLDSYARWLIAFLDELAVERCALFGTGSGGVLALELARREPTRITQCLAADIPAWDDAAEVATWLAEGFPDVEPLDDGSHLQRLWMRCRDDFLFFPWFDHDPDARREIDLPGPLELHVHFLDYLCGAPGHLPLESAVCSYGLKGVEAALAETATRVTVVSSPGQPFSTHQERLDVLHPQKVSPDERPEHIVSSLTAGLPPDDGAAAELPVERGAKRYATTRYGQVLVRRRAPTSPAADGASPLVLFHGGTTSSLLLEPLVELIARHRPAVAMDTLGNGDSDRHWFEDARIEDYAEVMAEGIDGLAGDRIDLYGTHTGAVLAIETAILRPDRVGSVILQGIPMFPPHLTNSRLGDLRPFAPSTDGSHLHWAWNYHRDGSLFWPVNEQTREAIRRAAIPAPEMLHTRVIEMLKAGPTFASCYRLALGYDARARLPLLRARALVCTTPDDPLGRHDDEAARLAPTAISRSLPPSIEAQADLYEAFLRQLI